MENKLFLIVAGAFIGWLFKELSNSFRVTHDSRRRLSRAIALIDNLNTEMLILSKQLDSFKDMANGWEDYERLRQYVIKRYPRDDDVFYTDISKAIYDVAEFFPFEAAKVDRAVQAYRFFRSMKLDYTIRSVGEDYYVKMLSLLEVTYEANQGEIDELLRKLAWRHGFFTWLAVRRKTTSIRVNQRKNVLAYQPLITEMRQKLNELKSAGRQDQSDPDAQRS